MGRILETIVKSNEVDSVLEYLNQIDIIVADRWGKILQVGEDFHTYYGFNEEEIIGRSVYDLEREGIFKPSSIAKVIDAKKEVTLIQSAKNGKRIITTAVPIKNEKDEIIRVISYSTDIEEYFKLKEWSIDLHEKIEDYNNKISQLEQQHRVMEEVLHKNPIFDYENIITQKSKKEKIMDDVITNNKDFVDSLNTIKKMSKYDVNILFQGETGVGKTMLAKKVHMLSNYCEGEFIEVNCGAIPHNLIESELFGYSKGAFTGANNDGKKGLIELAHKGTIFLDEVGELPLNAQVKLLKVIQDKEIRRIGGTISKKIDCRIIAATNKNLDKEVNSGNFRADLLYRLNTININIPPLRERIDDIDLLSMCILKKYNEKYQTNKIIDKKTLMYLKDYSWPGNIRELENVIQGLILTADDRVINPKIIPKRILDQFKEKKQNEIMTNCLEGRINDLNDAIENFESRIIKEYYKKYNSSIKLAKALNISQTTAARKIKKYIEEK